MPKSTSEQNKTIILKAFDLGGHQQARGSRSGTLWVPSPACFFQQRERHRLKVPQMKRLPTLGAFLVAAELVCAFSRMYLFCSLVFEATFPVSPLECMAGTTGLEPATSAVTGQHSNQLNYVPAMQLNGLRKTRVIIDDSRFRIQRTFRMGCTGWWQFPPLPPINRQ